MRVLLIGFSKIKYMPYINLYLQNIDCEDNEVHVLFWNRDIETEDLSAYKNVLFHEYKYFQEDQVKKIKKIKGFWGYRKFAQKVLGQYSFDRIVILHSMPGVLLQKYWHRRYSGKYIFDYRDSTYESIGFYRRIIAKLIKHSKFTVTSSDGFRIFFPRTLQGKVYTTHNILNETRILPHCPSETIRVAFWGFIREEGLNKCIIQQFAKDDRFELHYYGREQQTANSLRAFARSINAKNIFFHGEYIPEQRSEFAANTDLIHNIYSTPNMMLAMGNKYYDGLIFRLPQLCMEGAFMGNAASSAGVGIECNPNDEDFMKKIYNYYNNLDRTEFLENCYSEHMRVNEEYKSTADRIRECFTEG